MFELLNPLFQVILNDPAPLGRPVVYAQQGGLGEDVLHCMKNKASVESGPHSTHWTDNRTDISSSRWSQFHIFTVKCTRALYLLNYSQPCNWTNDVSKLPITRVACKLEQNRSWLATAKLESQIHRLRRYEEHHRRGQMRRSVFSLKHFRYPFSHASASIQIPQMMKSDDSAATLFLPHHVQHFDWLLNSRLSLSWASAFHHPSVALFHPKYLNHREVTATYVLQKVNKEVGRRGERVMEMHRKRE